MQVPMAQLGVSQHSSHDPNVTRVYAAIQEREWFSERGAMQSATNLDIESEWHASPRRNVCLSACLDPAFSGGGPSTASTRICRVGHTPRGGTLPMRGHAGPPHSDPQNMMVQSELACESPPPFGGGPSDLAELDREFEALVGGHATQGEST